MSSWFSTPPTDDQPASDRAELGWADKPVAGEPGAEEAPADERDEREETPEQGLPSMADLDDLSRHLDQIDATLARMDAEPVV